MGQGAPLHAGQRPHSRLEATRQPSSGPPKVAEAERGPRDTLGVPCAGQPRRRGCRPAALFWRLPKLEFDKKTGLTLDPLQLTPVTSKSKSN